MKSNKTTLVDKLYTNFDYLKKKQAMEIVDLIFETMANDLKNGDEVKIARLGVFRTKEVQERVGVDPRNGTLLLIPRQHKVVFKASDKLNLAVNNRYVAEAMEDIQ